MEGQISDRDPRKSNYVVILLSGMLLISILINISFVYQMYVIKGEAPVKSISQDVGINETKNIENLIDLISGMSDSGSKEHIPDEYSFYADANDITLYSDGVWRTIIFTSTGDELRFTVIRNESNQSVDEYIPKFYDSQRKVYLNKNNISYIRPYIINNNIKGAIVLTNDDYLYHFYKGTENSQIIIFVYLYQNVNPSKIDGVINSLKVINSK